MAAAAQGEHGVAGLGSGGGPGWGGHGCGVGVEHGEVAVGVDPRDRTLDGAAVGERHGGGAVAEVVGVGEHLARGDHEAGAPAVLADGHEGGAGSGERLPAGGGKIIENGHQSLILTGRCC
jgi:hypothetical protein